MDFIFRFLGINRKDEKQKIPHKEQEKSYYIQKIVPEKSKLVIYALRLENNKWYIGKTRNMKRRLSEHNISENPWISKNKIIDHIIIEEDCNSDFLEDLYVKEYINKYGIENVRGGAYSTEILTKNQIEFLEKEIVHANDRCFTCGSKNHFSDKCPKKHNKPNAKVCIKCKVNTVIKNEYHYCIVCYKKNNKAYPNWNSIKKKSNQNI
uniref:CCHC-type domain-containing protein n=1 Tax=viral metagenome TaxID=1070528 RepID=A0A6C0AF94_9ZZZZ